MKIRPVIVIVIIAAMLSLTGSFSLAADDAENAKLRAKLDALEKTVQGLTTTVKDQAREITALKTAKSIETDKAEIARLGRELEKDAANRPQGWLSVWSSLDIQLYGYIKLDAAWDSARTNAGNFARWVESEGGRERDGQFNMTARQTRLGMKIRGPEVGGTKTSGRVEIDFYGTGAENKPEPFMRHAYFQVDWPEQRFSLLAGQTSDVISPLVPSTINYPVQWWAGNIGYRRPQIRLTKGLELNRCLDMEVQLAVARTIGRTNTVGGTRVDPGDSGEDACLPGLQGRVAFSFPAFTQKRATVGFSGHLAKEEIDFDTHDHHENLYSWSANMDVSVPINGWLKAQGELYTGQDLDAYLGGIAQGVNMSTLKPIQACGGWGALSFGPWNKWRFNIGASVEALHGEDVTAASARTVNRSMFGNVIYQINQNASVAFEISHWHTEYKGLAGGDSLRLQTALMYKF